MRGSTCLMTVEQFDKELISRNLWWEIYRFPIEGYFVRVRRMDNKPNDYFISDLWAKTLEEVIEKTMDRIKKELAE